MNTHTSKAKSYDIGRPEYPETFFDFLYNETGLKKDAVIADIGCGTGKVTKHFLGRGSKIIAIEPDSDMLDVANKKLSSYSNYSSFQKIAEDTGIESGSIDCIFCGNSYYWFERSKVVPEFRRILRKDGIIVMSWCGNGGNKYDGELYQLKEKYKKPVLNKHDESPVFLPGTFLEKTFTYIINETSEEFLHGSLSASFSPSECDNSYGLFCKEIKELFDKHSINGKLEATMQLYCMIGSAENLAVYVS